MQFSEIPWNVMKYLRSKEMLILNKTEYFYNFNSDMQNIWMNLTCIRYSIESSNVNNKL